MFQTHTHADMIGKDSRVRNNEELSVHRGMRVVVGYTATNMRDNRAERIVANAALARG